MPYATATTPATRTAGRARPAPRSARPLRPAHVRAVLPANTLARAPACACGGGCPRCRAAETSTEGPAVQAKLEIGAPNDQYEQEADRVADQVVRMQEFAVGHSGDVTPTLSPLVQRQVEAQEDEEELQLKSESAAVLQRQEMEEEEEEEDVLQGQFTARETPAQLQGDAGEAAKRTGMPGRLKAGLEALSGMDLSGIRVHTNSSKPAQLNALAYTQGQDIHVGPGQEKHLPHEGWHAVQQMQGRVTSTMHAKGVSINDDAGLEHEADVMGAKAFQKMNVSQIHGNSNVPETFSRSHRVCACGGTCPKCRAEQGRQEQLQTKYEQASEAGNASARPIVQEVVSSAGLLLDQATRGLMKSRVGHDLSLVRVHAATRAVERARRFPEAPQRSAALEASEATVGVQALKGGAVVQRAMLCSKRLKVFALGRIFNHAYVDDTGQDDCLGRDQEGNLAIQNLKRGNFLRGCALKTSKSSDPQTYTPNLKRCDPKPGIGDVSACLRQAYSAYTDPSFYSNPFGPNSNTFVGTLARACCADASWWGLGLVPGWNHSPAGACKGGGKNTGQASGKTRGGGTVTKVQPRPFTGTTQGTFKFRFLAPRNPELGKAYVVTLFFESNGKDLAADVQFRLKQVDDDGAMHWESTNPEPVNIAPDGDEPKVIHAGNPAGTL